MVCRCTCFVGFCLGRGCSGLVALRRIGGRVFVVLVTGGGSKLWPVLRRWMLSCCVTRGPSVYLALLCCVLGGVAPIVCCCFGIRRLECIMLANGIVVVTVGGVVVVVSGSDGWSAAADDEDGAGISSGGVHARSKDVDMTDPAVPCDYPVSCVHEACDVWVYFVVVGGARGASKWVWYCRWFKCVITYDLLPWAVRRGWACWCWRSCKW